MTTAISTARRSWSLGGVAGVLGVAVPCVGLAIVPIWDFPATSATGAEISQYAAQNRSALQAMMLCYTVGVTLWSVLGAAVWADLRRALAPGSMVPTCFAAGLVGFVTLLLAGFVAFDVLVYRRSGSAEARMLYDLTFGLLAMSGMPTAVALAAFAVGVYRHRMLPRHTAHLAAAAAAGHVLLLLSFVIGTGFLSLEGAVIAVVPALLWAWILTVGIALIREGRSVRS